MESLSGSKEVWWLNAFESEVDRQQVTRDYESNAAIVQALEAITRRRHELVGTRFLADQPGGAEGGAYLKERCSTPFAW